MNPWKWNPYTSFKNWLKGDVLEIMTVDLADGTLDFSSGRVRCTPFFNPCDLWVGVYIDKDKRIVYICPLPTVGFKIYWGA